MKIYDEVVTPNGNCGTILLLRGYPEHSAYVDVYPKPEEGFEYIHLYDCQLSDTVIKALNLYKLSDLTFVSHSSNQGFAVIEIGELRIEKEKYKVSFRGVEKRLPKKEFEILLLLAQNPDKLLTRERIAENIWDGNLKDDKTLNVHMCRLRKFVDIIETIPGSGYKLPS